MDTRAIQLRLLALGYSLPGGADGVFGRNTMAAVAAFQKDRRLEVQWPGTVGPKTVEALNAVPLAGGPDKTPPPLISEVLLPPW